MNRRFAIIQAAVSVIALAAVVWWATHQEAPHIPGDSGTIAWIVGAVLLYALATVARAERWHHILRLTGVKNERVDSYALTTVGYMGNNVLPARAGEMLRVVLLDQRTNAGKRKLLGTVVAERLLDAVVLGAVFLIVVYGVLSDSALPTDRPVLMAGIVVAALIALTVAGVLVRRLHLFSKVRDFISPLAHAPRALLSREGLFLLFSSIFVWGFEASVYIAVAHAVDFHITVMEGLYIVALTNFVAALPAAPGSVGTFDAAVAFGARAVDATSSMAVSYLLILRLVLYGPITLVGLGLLVSRYGGWSRLRTATRLEASAS